MGAGYKGGRRYAWERIYDDTLTAKAQTITVSDLDLEVAGLYQMFFTVHNAEIGNGNVSLYVDDGAGTLDLVDANYRTEFEKVDGAVLSGLRSSNAIVETAYASESFYIEGTMMRDPEGYARINFIGQFKDPTGIVLRNYFWSHNDTTNVTKLRFASDAADTLGVGSRLIINGYTGR